MNIRSYKKVAARSSSSLLLGVVVLLWAYFLVAGYRQAPEPSEHSFALLREADVAIRVSRTLEHKSEVTKFLCNYKPQEEIIEELLGELENSDDQNLLDEDALRAYDFLTVLHTGNISKVDRQALVKSAEQWHLWAWEADVLRLFEERDVDIEAALEYDHGDDASVYNLYLIAPYLGYGFLLIGIPFIRDALGTFKALPRANPRRLVAQWNWKLLLTIILGVGLVDTWIPTIAYLLPELIWSLAPNFLEILVDGTWRFIIPAILIATFFTKWRHAIPLLGLDRLPHLKPVLGMISIVLIYDEILFRSFDAFDGISWATVVSREDGMSGLVYALLSGVVFAPIAEEVIYRGFLYRGLCNRFSYRWAFALSTLFFVMIHYYGWYGSLSVAAFSIAALPLYMATGSLWTPIIYHALSNLLITASYWPVYHGFYSL